MGEKRQAILGLAKATPTNGWCRRFGILCLIVAAAVLVSPAQDEQVSKFTTLFNFDFTNGDGPTGTLVQGTDGNFYGTTDAGGAYGNGTVFKITPSGTLTTLHDFDGTDGSIPFAGLVLATDGIFYGTTEWGGTSSTCTSGLGCGTVFKITTGGTLTTLHDFNGTDGQFPCQLVQGTDGNFYGTADQGGANGVGTVFKITPAGSLTTLYNFCSETGCVDGSYPNSPMALVQGSDGNFYGTTDSGGTSTFCGTSGCGTVFKITPSGTLSTLYSFCSQANCADGGGPYAGLVQGTDGNFYGTTGGYGANGQGGTVFKITPAGTLTTLYSFCSRVGCKDGFQPNGPLLQATDGNFYGMTVSNGPNGYGSVFRITPGGVFGVLNDPEGTGDTFFNAFAQGTDGSLYAPTYLGGTYGDGTIYSLSVGLGPFVETVPTSGKEGTPVKILGTDLLDATSVSFNGTSATFKVTSHSLILATVPGGATSGYVSVTTASGALKSDVRFQVRP